MPVVYKLQFHEITAPIVAAQTKFGGQPVWFATEDGVTVEAIGPLG